MRIVLDTNCLVQIISPHSKFHDVWLSLAEGRNVLCVSNEIIDEYVEILERPYGQTDEARIEVEDIHQRF